MMSVHAIVWIHLRLVSYVIRICPLSLAMSDVTIPDVPRQAQPAVTAVNYTHIVMPAENESAMTTGVILLTKTLTVSCTLVVCCTMVRAIQDVTTLDVSQMVHLDATTVL